MKKKITLSIDDDVYYMLGDIPRKVSVSEITSWMLKMLVEEIKLGREMTDKEIDEFYKRTSESKDFRERFRTIWGPRVKKMERVLGSLSISNKSSKKKKQ